MCRHGPLPQDIDLGQVSKILDVGAGTLAWTLDVANLPGVKHRLAPTVSNPIHLYACDITDAKFPPSRELEPLGITTFLHDVTTPFPQDLNGTFDLIHMRLLCSALSEQGWKKSLKHIHDALSMSALRVLMR
jgi:SAM-dependent methyltransferase